MNGTAPVLVLNRNWVPIRITSALDALSKMFEGRARAVSGDYSEYDFESWAELAAMKDEPVIVTAKSSLKVPEVILLATYKGIPCKKLSFSRANIYRRDRYTCQFCGKQPGTEELTIDHVVPKSRGGKTSWINCVLACLPCNRKKADRLPAEAGLKLRSKPIKPEWSPTLVLRRVKNTPANWKRFVSDAYWQTELEQDT